MLGLVKNSTQPTNLRRASCTEDKVFHEFEQGIERQLDRGRKQKKKYRTLAKIVGDGAADFVLDVVGKIGLHQRVKRVGQRQKLRVAPAQPIETIGVQIGIDCVNDDNRHSQQYDLAQAQPDEPGLAP